MSALTTASTRSPRSAPAPTGRPDLRVVPRRRRTWPYLVAMVAIAVAGVFGILSLSALAAEAAFAARTLEADIEELSLRYDELTAEVARLESPERVREVALEQLGMVDADQPAFLEVERHGRPAEVRGTAREVGAPLPDPLKQALGTEG